MKNLILIAGAKRSGKDYSAELIKELVEDTGVVSFAEPIKQILADTFEISLEALETYKNNSSDYGLELKAYPNNQNPVTFGYLSFRTALQRFGTEAMKQQFGDNVWGGRGVLSATKLPNNLVIIPDFRFVSEHEEAVKQARFFGYNVYTINIFNKDLSEADLHASERDLSDNNFTFDFSIDNTGQPDNIKKRVKKILKKANII